VTKKPIRMTPNPTNPNPTSNRSKNRDQKSQKLPPSYGRIIESRIEGRIQPHQEKKKSEHPARPAPPRWSSTPILDGLIVKLFLLRHRITVTLLPPPVRPASCQPSSSSASAAAHVLCLCCRTFVNCCFLSLLSASLSPLHHPYLLFLCSIRHVSSAAVTFVDCCFLLLFSALLSPLPQPQLLAFPLLHLLHLFNRCRPPPHPTVVASLMLRMLHIC
jgi:hypothetical protein